MPAPHEHRHSPATDVPPAPAQTLPTLGGSAPPAAEASAETQPPRTGEALPVSGASAQALPGYEILGELGRGGMGVVYKARQQGLDRVVALKMILMGGLAGEAERARFKVEAEAIARLQHPNIVAVYEVGEHDGRPFFSLEFCPGGSLERKLNGTPLPPPEAAHLVETLARAIQAAHDRHVIHRDLKPANVLLGDGGSPKITDFGLAKKLDDDSGQTRSGAIMGTPSYMAPEQAEGKKDVGPPADVYALGAILYELLTGRPPFRAATTMDTLVQVCSEDPVRPRQFQPGTPRDLETICLKCLHKEASRRYATALELAEDLRRFQTGEPIQARPVGSRERAIKWVKRRPAVAALLAVVALATVGLVAGGVWFTARLRDERDVARKREGEANEARRGEAEQHRQAEQQLDRARRMLMTAQLLRVAAIFQRDPQAAQGLLEDGEACPAEMRDFAWGYYFAGCRRQRQVFTAPGMAEFLAFTDGGRSLATGGPKGVRLWDAVSGKEKQLPPKALRGQFQALSPDGKTMALTALDEKFTEVVYLWDTASGRTRATLPVSGRPLGFTADGRTLACCAGRVVKLWDVATGRPKGELMGHKEAIQALSFTADGATLATVGSLGEIKVWNVAMGKESRSFRWAGHGGPGILSPDGKWLAMIGTRAFGSTLGDLKPVVSLRDAVTGQERFWVRAHPEKITALSFAPDSLTLATAGDDAARLWDMTAGAERLCLRGKGEAGAQAVAFSPDGQALAVADEKGAVTLWSVGLLKAHLRPEHAAEVAVAVTSADGKTLISAGEDGEVKVWDLPGGKLLRAFRAEPDVLTVALTPDGKTLVTCPRFQRDGKEDAEGVKVWDVAAGRVRRVLKGAASPVALSPDGRTLATSAVAPGEEGETDEKGGKILLWDLNTGKVRGSLRGLTAPVGFMTFGPDGRTLAVGDFDGSLKLWDVEAGKERLELSRNEKAVAVTFAADGKSLYSGGVEGLKRWDATTGKRLASFKGGRFAVHTVAFSPDGRTLASGGEDGKVRLWDPVTGQERAALPASTLAVQSIHFVDGRTVVGGGKDRMVRVWKALFP